MPRSIGPEEVGWQMFRKAETHEPHAPERMRSAQSKCPPYFWFCGRPECRNYTYTYQPDAPAPTCSGGARWSFQTLEIPEDE